MKSLKLFAVAAIFGAFMTSCEAESISEDENLIEEIEVFSETGGKVDVPSEDPEGD